jgi:hypothetical protein
MLAPKMRKAVISEVTSHLKLNFEQEVILQKTMTKRK